MKRDNPEFIKAFERGLRVLCVFGAGARRLTAADVAKRADITRAAARRFLFTLRELGYVKEDGRYYELTPAVLRIGYAYLSSLEFREGIQSRLQQVTEVLNESSSAAVLDGNEIVYIARSAAPQRLVSTNLGVGARLPAHATSMGLVLLAGLSQSELEAFISHSSLERFTEHTAGTRDALKARIEKVRGDGYALVDQEREHGLRSIALPLRDRTGAVVAAVNVSTHVGRTSPKEMIERFLPVLRQAVSDCEAALRFRG